MDVLGLNTDRHQNLSNAHTGCCSIGLTICTTHTGLKPISTSACKHFVDAKDGEWMHAHANVVRLFSSILDEILVASHASCFQCL